MGWTIAHKLFLVLVLTSAITLALSVVLGRWSFERDFLAYKAAQESQLLEEITVGFASHYMEYQGWSQLLNDPTRWRQLLRNASPRPFVKDAPARYSRPPSHHPGAGPMPPGSRDSGRNSGRGAPPGRSGGAGPGYHRDPRMGPGAPPHDPLQLHARLGLYDVDANHVAGSPSSKEAGTGAAIVVSGERVGELRLAPTKVLTAELDLSFSRGQGQSLLWIALAVLVLASLASLVLAPQLTRPIKRFAARAKSMAGGNYEERLAVVDAGELGSLTADMNELAQTLEHARRSRQQWIADISHELRTPLAILTAELQALEDGIRDYNAGTRASLQLEVQRLNRLVQDLYELSAADEGAISISPVQLDVIAIVADCVEGSRARIGDHGLALDVELPEQPILLFADALRLSQLFTNLIENTLRYTDAPGTLRLRCEQSSGMVHLIFADSAPAVPQSSLPKVFERLYRLEPSRGRHSGGSGLGLAICKAITKAHGGSIRAEQSPLGGLLVRVSLPLAAPADAGVAERFAS